MIDLHRQPTSRELAWFGLAVAGVLALLGLVLWARFGLAVARWPWGVATVLAVVYYAVPPLRRPIYVGWIWAMFPIAWTVSHVLLAIVYYLVLTPLGLLRRLIGGDPMHRRIDRAASSYWVERRSTDSTERYFRQY